MSDEQIKSKVISFRLSDQEFGTVQQTSQKYGFASVCLFARSATLICDSGETAHSPMDVDLNRLWRRIESLTAALESFAAKIGITQPSE